MSDADITQGVHKTYSVSRESLETPDGRSYVYRVSAEHDGVKEELDAVNQEGKFLSREDFNVVLANVSGLPFVRISELLLYDAFGCDAAKDYNYAVCMKVFGSFTPQFEYAKSYEITSSDLFSILMDIRMERQQSVAGPQGVQGFQGNVGVATGWQGSPAVISPSGSIYPGHTHGWAVQNGAQGSTQANSATHKCSKGRLRRFVRRLLGRKP